MKFKTTIFLILIEVLYLFSSCQLNAPDVSFGDIDAIYFIMDDNEDYALSETFYGAMKSHIENIHNSSTNNFDFQNEQCDIGGKLFIHFNQLIETLSYYYSLKDDKGYLTFNDKAITVDDALSHELLSIINYTEFYTRYNPPSFYIKEEQQDKRAITTDVEWLLFEGSIIETAKKWHQELPVTIRIYNPDHLISYEYQGTQPTRVNVHITSTESSMELALDPTNPQEYIPMPSAFGNYTYTLTAYFDESPVIGTMTSQFELIYQHPISYELTDTTFQPGDCIGIQIQYAQNLDYKVTTDFYDGTIGLFYKDSTEESLVGLIPIDPRTAPGDYSLRFYQASTGILLKEYELTISEKFFEKQELTIASSTASLKSDDNAIKDAEKYKGAKDYSVGEKLWNGAFLQPVQGRISTEYSMIRTVNGGQESSRHSGIDIAAPLGTPVLATEKGIVTFASDLIISGNVITLDHGYGVFSSYVHLDKIFVSVGDVVEEGDIIGEVGTTGYSTGPHLHFTIWKNGVYLNPWKFFEADPLDIFY